MKKSFPNFDQQDRKVALVLGTGFFLAILEIFFLEWKDEWILIQQKGMKFLSDQKG